MEALGINLPGLIAQIVNFSLLLLLLRAFAFKPILGMLDERSSRIRESMEQVERIKEDRARAEQEFQARVDEAKKEGQAIVAQASQVGERMVQEAGQEARKEAEALLARARAEIEMERERAVEDIRKHFADLTVLAASKVISQSLDKDAHRQLINEVLEEASTVYRG